MISHAEGILFAEATFLLNVLLILSILSIVYSIIHSSVLRIKNFINFAILFTISFYR